MNQDYKDPYKKKSPYKKAQKLELNCISCDHPISHDQININKTLAKCNNCQTVFSFNEAILFDKGGRKNMPAPISRPEILVPKGTEVLHLADSLDIRTNWFDATEKGSLVFKSIFTLIWCGVTFAIAFSMLDGPGLSSLPFIAGHLAVSFGLLFWTSSSFLNNTDVIVDKDYIYINHGPIRLPWKKEIIVPVDQIKQVYVSRYSNSSTNGVPDYKFALYAISVTGKKIELAKGLNEQTQQYIEQEIEKYLDITDQPVHGEWRKK